LNSSFPFQFSWDWGGQDLALDFHSRELSIWELEIGEGLCGLGGIEGKTVPML